MITRTIDYSLAHKFYAYGRMSDLRQNPRSPDQQFTTIEETLTRQGYTHWKSMRKYRDDGISGRRETARAGYRQMIADVISRRDSVSFILVDSMQRFSRADNIQDVRRWLFDQSGVVILSANKSFADPTTVQGQVHGMFEEFQVVQEGRTKAHDVLRGKKDAVLLKRWPGGDPPFGFRLKTLIEVRGGKDHPYSVLVPDPETAWIVRLVFQQALKTGWGRKRLSQFLHDHPDVPVQYRPLPTTLGEWLTNEIYVGIMIYPKCHTDVIDSIRVMQPAEAAEQLRVDDFCEPIVPPELFWPVCELVRARGDHLRAAREAAALAKGDSKPLIPAVASGMTLKYPLTGLVVCDHCKHPMRPSRSPVYTAANGDERVYAQYVCSKHADGLCPNGTSIPIEWLWDQVVATLRARLFPGF